MQRYIFRSSSDVMDKMIEFKLPFVNVLIFDKFHAVVLFIMLKLLRKRVLKIEVCQYIKLVAKYFQQTFLSVVIGYIEL